MKFFLQAVSHLFHPLFSLTYAAMVFCSFTPLVIFSDSAKMLFVGEVLFYTTLLPIAVILLLHTFHVIGHWNLRDVRDRTIPFLTNFVCYTTCFMVLQASSFLPSWVLMPYFGSVILTFVAWVISFWWKISAHAAGNASAATLFIYLYYYLPSLIPLWLVFGAVLMTGVICSIRLYLGRHTLAQVGAGALLGIVSMTIGAIVYF